MIISFYLAQVDNFQRFILFVISLNNLNENSTLNYSYVECTLNFFYKILNKWDFLKIVNLYLIPNSKTMTCHTYNLIEW